MNNLDKVQSDLFLYNKETYSLGYSQYYMPEAYKNNVFKNILGPATIQNLGETGVIYLSETFLPGWIQNKLYNSDNILKNKLNILE